MNPFTTLCLTHRSCLAGALLVMVCLFSCREKENSASPSTEHNNAGIIQNTLGKEHLPLLTHIELHAPATATTSPETLIAAWENGTLPLNKYQPTAYHTRAVWAKLQFTNPDTLTHTRVLYFPKGWSHLVCYTPQPDGSLLREDIGSQHHDEVISIQVPAAASTHVYVYYPATSTAYYPLYEVLELTTAAYQDFHSRIQLKFLLMGTLLFPLLYFLVQLLVQRDRLNLYYLLFLAGSTLYLIIILDGAPYFELSHRIVPWMPVLQRLFVISIFLLLFGLVKYIHEFLRVFDWSPLLGRIGNGLLTVLLLVVLIPLVVPKLFRMEIYSTYLQVLRPIALGVFIYTIILTVRGARQRLPFSKLLLIAFVPFLITAIGYAISFILIDGYSNDSVESLSAIVGFIVTLLLFGVMLGVRSNALKAEKLKLEREAVHLGEMDKFKTRFYTNITHEFRTPLTVIKGVVSQITGHDKLKAVVQRNCDQLLTMVNQLLDLSRLESNKLAVSWVHGDILPYLRYLTESFHSLAKDKQLNLAFFSPADRMEMDFDEQKIQQIITNLLSNAIKFTPMYGSVKVVASMVSEGGKENFKLAVSDTGHGIAKEQLPFIFDRFFQTSDRDRRAGEGSGIGLSLVRELVQLMDGSIRAESEPGVGTTFHVVLPVHHVSQIIPSGERTPVPVSGKATEWEEPELLTDENKPIVLIIEDNTDVTNYIVSCLAADYQLLTARDGKAGVEKAIEHIPDVILSDVMMPEMDGFEVCQRLKADKKTSHIPIVLLTAKAAQEDRLEGLSLGADAYLTKPFDKEELLIRLTHLAAQSKLLRDLLRQRESPDAALHEEVQATRELAFLQELDVIIDTNLSDDSFDTLQLCKEVAMSRTQLHRKLKALTGKSTASYIRTLRLQRAKTLLSTTDLAIGEIASRVGYKDFSHFSKSFNKEFGFQPSVVRG